MGLWRLTSRDFRVGVGGAILLAAVTAAINFQGVQHNPVETLFFPTLAGFIVGWMYSMAWDTLELVTTAQKELKDLTTLADQAIGPLSMLLKAQRHAPALGALIKDSIVNKQIAYVTTSKYLNYLTIAVRNSDVFYGLHRNRIRWFKDQEDGAVYLQNLRTHRMRQKRRIVVIEAESDMLEDLANKEVMDFYWENTGDDVRTFWISAKKFGEENRDLRDPSDFALYDEELLIQYDDKVRTITFAQLKPDAPENKIFKQLDEQLKNDSPGPYTEIKPPTPGRLPSSAAVAVTSPTPASPGGDGAVSVN